jgi:hypothetical protein
LSSVAHKRLADEARTAGAVGRGPALDHAAEGHRELARLEGLGRHRGDAPVGAQAGPRVAVATLIGEADRERRRAPEPARSADRRRRPHEARLGEELDRDAGALGQARAAADRRAQAPRVDARVERRQAEVIAARQEPRGRLRPRRRDQTRRDRLPLVQREVVEGRPPAEVHRVEPVAGDGVAVVASSTTTSSGAPSRLSWWTTTSSWSVVPSVDETTTRYEPGGSETKKRPLGAVRVVHASPPALMTWTAASLTGLP